MERAANRAAKNVPSSANILAPETLFPNAAPLARSSRARPTLSEVRLWAIRMQGIFPWRAIQPRAFRRIGQSALDRHDLHRLRRIQTFLYRTLGTFPQPFVCHCLAFPAQQETETAPTELLLNPLLRHFSSSCALYQITNTQKVTLDSRSHRGSAAQRTVPL